MANQKWKGYKGKYQSQAPLTPSPISQPIAEVNYVVDKGIPVNVTPFNVHAFPGLRRITINGIKYYSLDGTPYIIHKGRVMHICAVPVQTETWSAPHSYFATTNPISKTSTVASITRFLAPVWVNFVKSLKNATTVQSVVAYLYIYNLLQLFNIWFINNFML